MLPLSSKIAPLARSQAVAFRQSRVVFCSAKGCKQVDTHIHIAHDMDMWTTFDYVDKTRHASPLFYPHTHSTLIMWTKPVKKAICFDHKSTEPTATTTHQKNDITDLFGKIRGRKVYSGLAYLVNSLPVRRRTGSFENKKVYQK